MSDVTRRALRVYAALSELKGKNEDVLDALIPFFEPILARMNGKMFDPHVFSAGVRHLYRWRFTGDIASTFIPRLEKRNYLKEQAKQPGRAVIYTVHYTDPPIDMASSPIATALEEIINEFEKFPPKVTDLLSYKKTREELKDILIRFLVTMDASGEGAFARQLGDLEPGSTARELIGELREGGQPLDPNDRYMCARFVQHLMKNKREFVPYLTRLSSIGLLAEVVEDFLKPTHTEGKTDLTVVLDAPIALDLLGCSGKALKDDVETVLNALRKIGAIVVVFPVSCMEMQHNLRAVLNLPIDRRHGYTQNALIKKETSLAFVQAVANNPERALDSIGIAVRPVTLKEYPNLHKNFTNDHYEDFLSSIEWGNNMHAREHDAECMTLVMRIRDGKQSSDIFKNRIVMVTRNGKFVGHARNYCLQSKMINQMQEGPIIHARDLATTAWLRTGLGADETIPRGHLIATCDRVLQVKPEVRNALAAQLAQVTPESLGQLNLLMQDARSVQKLADATLNNEEVVTPENAEHLLQVMREATVEELKVKHDAELKTERQVAAAALTRASSQVDTLAGKVAALELRDAQSQSFKESQVRGVVTAINQRSKAIQIVVAGLFILVGVVGVANFFLGTLEGHWVWAALLAFFGAAGFVDLCFTLFGGKLPGLRSLMNLYCERLADKRLAELGLSDHSTRLTYANGRVAFGKNPTLTSVERKEG